MARAAAGNADNGVPVEPQTGFDDARWRGEVNPVGNRLGGNVGAAIYEKSNIVLMAHGHQDPGGGQQLGLANFGQTKLDAGYIASVQGFSQDIGEAVRLKGRRRNQVEAATLRLPILVIGFRRRTSPWRRRSGRSARRR